MPHNLWVSNQVSFYHHRSQRVCFIYSSDSTSLSRNLNNLQQPFLQQSHKMLLLKQTIKTLLFFCSIQPDQLGQYWLVMYSCQVILPGIAMCAIALKIILKSGKDLQRELIGVRVVRIHSEKHTSIKKSNHPETAFDFLKNYNAEHSYCVIE